MYKVLYMNSDFVYLVFELKKYFCVIEKSQMKHEMLIVFFVLSSIQKRKKLSTFYFQGKYPVFL